MNHIIILISIILLAVLIGKNPSPYARTIIASIYGILIFSIWRYYIFYANLYDVTKADRHIVYFALLIGATLLAIILVRIKYYIIVATVTVMLFITSTIASYFASSLIEDEVAIISGFYKQEIPQKFVKTAGEREFIQTIGRYSVILPVAWIFRKDKGPYFPYFTWQNSGKQILEFRPRCFNRTNITIPQIIINERASDGIDEHSVSTLCHEQKSNSEFSCRVKIFHKNKQLKKIEYFATYGELPKGVELDFVLNQYNPNVLMQVNRVIQSVEPMLGKSDNRRCLGLTKWM